MAEFLFLMHDDITGPETGWDLYIDTLSRRGVLRGGSSLGAGKCYRKPESPTATVSGLVGFIRIEATSLVVAESLLAGNPVYEAGGTVEIRPLIEDD